MSQQCDQVAKKAKEILTCVKHNVAKQDQGSDRSSALDTGHTLSIVMFAVLGPSIQKRLWGAGASPENGLESESSEE